MAELGIDLLWQLANVTVAPNSLFDLAIASHLVTNVMYSFYRFLVLNLISHCKNLTVSLRYIGSVKRHVLRTRRDENPMLLYSTIARRATNLCLLRSPHCHSSTGPMDDINRVKRVSIEGNIGKSEHDFQAVGVNLRWRVEYWLEEVDHGEDGGNWGFVWNCLVSPVELIIQKVRMSGEEKGKQKK